MRHDDHHDLIPRLFVELFQHEESACKHPRVESERLDGVPPGQAMRAAAAHAEAMKPELERLAQSEGLETTSLGTRIGDAFSALRKVAFDPLLDREKSYRTTLIGLYHGVDVARLLRSTARAEGRDRIVAFCDAWLTERSLLVGDAARQLEWFGENPRVAIQSATNQLGPRRADA
jgi:hypothetical protein